MTDPRGTPRRVSLGYILGFSDQPFKDPKPPMPTPPPPPPRKPNQLTSLVSSPGGIVEWAASDGRKGRLRETGKSRPTATTLTNVSSENRCIKDALDSKSGSNKAADLVTGAENRDGNAAADVVLNKPQDECKASCKHAHPGNLNSDGAKKDGKGNEGKQKKAKGSSQDQNQGGYQSEKKKEKERKEQDTAGAWGEGLGGGIFAQIDDKNYKPDKTNDDSGTGDAQGGTEGGNQEGMWASWDVPSGGGAGNNKDADISWDAPAWGGDGGATNCLETTKGQNDTVAEGALATDRGPTIAQDNNNSNNTGGNFQPSKNANKPAPTSRSNKAQSQFRSHHSTPSNRKPAPNRPLELEIKPDDVFSADDLRLVARILQQDCAMVWNRVSWRFRDKTGRTLYPDVFEKKIQGQLQGKGSERGEWRK